MEAVKKELQAKFNRDLIIDTAESLFFINGIEKTTMDEIAKVAGYSKSTMYVYFKSKEEIYNHIIYRGMSNLKNRFNSIANSPKSFTDKYYDICYNLVEFQDQYPLYFDGIQGNISIEFNQEDKLNILHQIYLVGEDVNAVIGRLISEGIASGALRKDLKVPETIFMLWASISGIVKIAGLKTAYIEKHIQTSKAEFLQYNFSLLFNSIKAV